MDIPDGKGFLGKISGCYTIAGMILIVVLVQIIYIPFGVWGKIKKGNYWFYFPEGDDDYDLPPIERYRD